MICKKDKLIQLLVNENRVLKPVYDEAYQLNMLHELQQEVVPTRTKYLQKLQSIFDKEPELVTIQAQSAWHRLKPLQIEMHLFANQLSMDVSLTIGECVEDNMLLQGQFNQELNVCGIARCQIKGGGIYEGNWQDKTRNGYGRMIYADGAVQEGMWKDGVKL